MYSVPLASPKMNPLNVYTGTDSIQKYFDPDSSPPLPLVEVPECLNPYRQDGVRIYAKMMSMHPTNNVKSMPALNLLQNSVVPGKTKTVVEYSSGSTVLSMSLIGKGVYGMSDVKAYLSNKTSVAKLRLMQLFGINITLFGGPSQPEPTDHRGGIHAAHILGQDSDDVVNPNQYANDNNWKSHIRWTGPQILKQLPDINVICAGMGTSGTMTGLGTFFKDAKPSVFRLGVCTAAGDRVPGPRSYALLAPVEFPWRKAVDQIEEVGSADSYSLSLELIRNGLVCGPSSGFNLQGLYQMLAKRKSDGTMNDIKGADGQVHCVFLCCDLPYQYVNEYFDKLGAQHFPAMKNEELLHVDLYRYDEAWERDAIDALGSFYQVDKDLIYRGVSDDVVPSLSGSLPKPGSVVVDLRQPADFQQGSLPGAVNVPFVQRETCSPFSDPAILKSVWTRLEDALKAPNEHLEQVVRDQHVLFVCYDGDTSRVANSVLRAKGFRTESVRGGFDAISKLQKQPAKVDAELTDMKQSLPVSSQIRTVVG